MDKEFVVSKRWLERNLRDKSLIENLNDVEAVSYWTRDFMEEIIIEKTKGMKIDKNKLNKMVDDLIEEAHKTDYSVINEHFEIKALEIIEENKNRN